jgi:putative glutamine transport system substrate-binding protein
MKIKKLTALTAALVLGTALVFTGCSSDNDATSTGSEAAIQKIKDKGVLKVGVKVDVPKYGYKNTTTGEVEGLEIDIAKAVAKKIFGDESKIETTAVTAKTRGPLLDNGEIDAVIATFTITEERKQSYNFSDPYFTDGVGLLVKKSLGAKEFKDLDGKNIGVAQSSTTKKALEEEATKAGITLKFSEFGSYPELSAALDSGRIDCFSVDASILNGYLDDSKEILDFRTNPQEYGIATKKSNEGLATLVNEVISEMKSSGELDKLISTWEIK